MAMNSLLKQLVSNSAGKYKSGGNSRVMKLKDGRNTFRIIAPGAWQGEPMTPGENNLYWRDIGVHWIKTDPSAKPMVIGSTEIIYGEPSTLSAAVEMAIANAMDEDQKKFFTEWRARKSVLLNVVSRDKGDSVEVLELTPTTFGKILALIEYYDDEGANVLDHNAGFDFVVTKTGTGLNTEYDVQVAPLLPGKAFKSVNKDQIAAAENLDNFIKSNYFREDEQKAISLVSTIAGIQIPRIGAPATPVAALTSSAASVAPTSTPSPVATGSTPAEIQAQAMAMAQQMVQQMMTANNGMTGVTAAPAAAPVTVDVSQNVTPETSILDLSDTDQDALLAELNALGGAN